MRAFLWLAPLWVMLACSGKDEQPGAASGGQMHDGGAGVAGGAGAASGGGASSGGGVNAAAGTSAIGGRPAAVGGGGATSGGAASGVAGTSDNELVDCDARKAVCKIAQPLCPENQVPSVLGNCFGPCVAIESCACSVAADCPLNDRYTCWQRTHCGPYVR